MTDEKKFTGWKRTYIGLLNAATVICILLGIIINVGGWIGSDIFRAFTGFGSDSSRTSESSSTVTRNADDAIGAFDKVEGSIDAGNVKFVYGDDYGFSYENYPEKEVPKAELNGKTLKITQKAKNKKRIGDFSNSFKGAEIVITLPKEMAVDVDLHLSMGAVETKGVTFGDVKLDADMGSIELDTVTIKDMDLTADMGAITVEDSVFSEGDIKASMGGIELKNVTFDEADLEADMGGIKIDGSFNDLKAKCSMGGIDVTADDSDAKMNLSADLGGITVNGQSVGRNYKN
ncbi:MAG: DUF4097 domain-containing protein [Lachnospiraceae bacterium]|nr:DUF4097 domain-containing protein [Lachnospiraceae bacterium]